MATAATRRLLVINAHQVFPGISMGRLNQTFVDTITDEAKKLNYEVKHTEIEKGYNPMEEVEKHEWADVIILQTPVYWFSTPWIYKKYVDEVFTTGLATQKLAVDDGRTREDPTKQYGTGGKMQGKKYGLSITWNAPKEAFSDTNQYLFRGGSADDVFLHNTANYRFLGADILPSFSSYNVMKAPNVESDVDLLRQHIQKVLA